MEIIKARFTVCRLYTMVFQMKFLLSNKNISSRSLSEQLFQEILTSSMRIPKTILENVSHASLNFVTISSRIQELRKESLSSNRTGRIIILKSIYWTAVR